jgi:4-aminobutyrate aminotransferase
VPSSVPSSVPSGMPKSVPKNVKDVEPSYDALAAHSRPKLITEVPGPQARARIERDGKVTSPSLPRAYAFVPRRGAGSIVEDVDGNLFLDINAGIAVTSTGHCHPRVVEAVQRQAAELLHYSASDFYLPVYSDVAERLNALAPFGGARARTFLSNSGTEAVEAAIKLARYATGRQYLIGFYQSFHGRSMGSVTLTASKAKYRQSFGPMLPSVYHSFYGDFDYIEEVLFTRVVTPGEVAAIVVESWLGEGGYILPPEGWFRYLRDLCDRHGILLVCDEVQSGMGRSGTMWAIEQEGVAPDIVVAGKGIASGLPLGAMIARDEVMTWEPGAHGSTYGGSPVPCAAALATLDVIEEEGLMGNASRVGEVFLAGLREVAARHPIVTEVRGRALWIGLSLTDHDTAAAVEQACFHKGLLALGCGDDAIRISPPLVFREDQATAALEIFEEAVAEVEATGS